MTRANLMFSPATFQNPYFQSEPLSLLLTWCRLASSAHLGGVSLVSNFTTSFADGRAFCYIVSHYLPDVIAPSDIHNYTTTNKVKPKEAEADNSPFEEVPAETNGKPQFLYFSPGNRPESVSEPKTQRQNELKNVALLHNASAALNMPLDGTIYAPTLCTPVFDFCFCVVG